MNNAAEAVLQQLKDIQQPVAVAWWPLASGWYVLLGLIIILLAVSVYLGMRHWFKLRRRRQALQQVTVLRSWYAEHSNKQQVASQLSILLKQASFVHYPRPTVAGLYDDNWLIFLDEISRSTDYTQGCGRILITAPYASQTDANLDGLFSLVERTLKRCL